jgi:hypothetical protein
MAFSPWRCPNAPITVRRLWPRLVRCDRLSERGRITLPRQSRPLDPLHNFDLDFTIFFRHSAEMIQGRQKQEIKPHLCFHTFTADSTKIMASRGGKTA